MPDRPGLVLDVGAGIGGAKTDWPASHGHEVVAVEPFHTMSAKGQGRHPDPRIRQKWSVVERATLLLFTLLTISL